jgi:hypothetical protein
MAEHQSASLGQPIWIERRDNMKTKRVILTLGLLAVLGAGGFAAAKLIGGAAGTEAERPGQVDFDTIERRQATETAQPRFVGELLGIFIGPSKDTWPEQVRAEDDRVLAGGCVNVPRSTAGALEFPRPLALPAGYAAEEEQPAVACSGKVTGLGWGYSGAGSSGVAGHVSISRAVSKALEYNVAANRVSVRSIGGRDAIFVRPVTDDGLAQISYVVFPESFGVTEIQMFNLPDKDVLAVAEAVAEASK